MFSVWTKMISQKSFIFRYLIFIFTESKLNLQIRYWFWHFCDIWCLLLLDHLLYFSNTIPLSPNPVTKLNSTPVQLKFVSFAWDLSYIFFIFLGIALLLFFFIFFALYEVFKVTLLYITKIICEIMWSHVFRLRLGSSFWMRNWKLMTVLDFLTSSVNNGMY